MCLPLVSVLVFVFAAPLVFSFISAFFSEKGRYIGLENYSSILSDRWFRASLSVTATYVITYTVSVFLVGIGTSLLLWYGERRYPRFSVPLKVIITLPYAIPEVVSALVWSLLYDTRFGFLNYFLQIISFGYVKPQMWLQNPQLALLSVVFATVWRLFPFHTLVLLGAYRTIPRELLECATLDGASSLTKFLRIVVPQIKNILASLLLLTIVWSLNRFTILWLLTQGGPARATEVTTVYIFREAFIFLRRHRATAGGTILAMIATAIIGFYLFFQYRRARR